MDKILERQENGDVTLVTLVNLDDATDSQKWTQTTVDEIENYFIWSNKAEIQNKFLAAPDSTNLIMKGKENCSKTDLPK